MYSIPTIVIIIQYDDKMTQLATEQWTLSTQLSESIGPFWVEWNHVLTFPVNSVDDWNFPPHSHACLPWECLLMWHYPLGQRGVVCERETECIFIMKCTENKILQQKSASISRNSVRSLLVLSCLVPSEYSPAKTTTILCLAQRCNIHAFNSYWSTCLSAESM